jgi:Tol biopolymer transport system component
VTSRPIRQSTADKEPGGLTNRIAWSPDGKRIAYVCYAVGSGRDTPPNICVVDIATGVQTLLAKSTAAVPIAQNNNDGLSWSSRSNEIAVELDIPIQCPPPYQDRTGCTEPDIGLADADTGKIAVLTRLAKDAAFSPNGEEIAYVPTTSSGQRGGISVMSSTGTPLRQVVPAAHAAARGRVGPAWSPDGKTILFSTNTDGAENGNEDIFEVSAQGGPLHKVITDPNPDQDPAEAPAVTNCTVPKLTGETLTKAKALIKRAGCVLGKVTGPRKNRGKRKVVAQKPAAKTNVPAGSKVNVQVH